VLTRCRRSGDAPPLPSRVLITEIGMSCCWYLDIGDSKVERAPQGNGCPSTFVQHARELLILGVSVSRCGATARQWGVPEMCRKANA